MAVVVVPGVVIGRDAEMAQLGQWVDDLATGRGRAILVEGEPGIGKSALLRAAVAEAVGHGCPVLWGAADELGQAFPLQPLIDALATNSAYRTDVLRALRSGPGTPTGGHDAVAAASERLLATVDDLCAASPTMLVIDDLQWSDTATLSIWSRLARAAEQMPLLLVGAARPVPHRDDVIAATARVLPQHTVTLTALEPTAITQIITTMCRATPGDALTALATGAAGNPLYLTELLDSLDRNGTLHVTEDGHADVLDGPFPASLSDAITDRLRFLAEPDRDIVRTAALLGPEFTVDELTTVCEIPLDELLASLRHAYSAGVLADHGSTLAFRHPLIRSALYHEEPASIRAAWHRRAARALMAAGAPPEHVARQLVPALTATTNSLDETWMLEWLVANAALLTGQSPQVSVQLLERAVLTTGPGDAFRDVLNCRLADALSRTGDATRAQRVAERTLYQTTDPDLIVALCEILTFSMWHTGRGEEVAPITRRALTMGTLTERHRNLIRIVDVRGRMYREPGGTAEAIRLADQMLAEAAADDRHVRVWAMVTLADALRIEPTELAMATFDEAIALAQGEPELADVNLLAMGNRAQTLIAHDQFAAGVIAAEQVRREAESTGNPTRLQQAVRILVLAQFFAGDWDGALMDLDGLRADGPTEMRIQVHAMIATIAAHRGRADTVEAELAAARALGEDIVADAGVWLAVTIIRHEQLGTLGEAIPLIRAALARHGEAFWQIEEWLADGVRAAMLADTPEVAAAIVEVADANDKISTVPNHTAVALHCRGLYEREPKLLIAAAERYQSCGRVLARAQALDAAAVAFAEAGNLAEARTVSASAIDLYTELDAAWDLDRLSADLRGHGIQRRPTGPRSRATHGWESLSPAETRVAALVAQGLSNPRIAEQLLLSRRTVQTHVAHILTKLDIHSRVDIARIAVQQAGSETAGAPKQR